MADEHIPVSLEVDEEIEVTLSSNEEIGVSLTANEDMEVAMSSDEDMGVDFGSVMRVPTTSSAWLTEVTLPSSAWTGSGKLWSQVVNIEDTTPYSKVDLTPSAVQLTLFHEKDIAFTTENNDGIVTVFAIGDRPANDYTIPAVVTEVSI